MARDPEDASADCLSPCRAHSKVCNAVAMAGEGSVADSSADQGAPARRPYAIFVQTD